MVFDTFSVLELVRNILRELHKLRGFALEELSGIMVYIMVSSFKSSLVWSMNLDVVTVRKLPISLRFVYVNVTSSFWGDKT